MLNIAPPSHNPPAVLHYDSGVKLMTRLAAIPFYVSCFTERVVAFPVISIGSADLQKDQLFCHITPKQVRQKH